MSLNLEQTTALVTGANRGLGREIARSLVARGAKKVYAAARDPRSIDLPGVVPVALDVTNLQQIAAAANQYKDVSLLINNAGISERGDLLDADSIARARRAMEVNYFGPLALATAFAPALRAQPQSAVVNILSALSWLAPKALTEYSASKAAAWAFTNGLRTLFQPDAIQVVGLHVGFMDTDMAANVKGEKISPTDVAAQILEALEQGKPEVTADAVSRQLRSQLGAEPGFYLYGPAL